MARFCDSVDLFARSPVVRAMLAYGSGEMAVRIIRLIVVIIIARQLVPEMVGLAALSLTIFELVRVLAQIGIGQQIIAAADDQVEAICNSAHRIFWFWCIMVAVVQLLIAVLLYGFFDQQIAGQMLACLCGVYLFMPGGLVSCFRLMRAKRLTVTARITAQQAMLDHVLTACLITLWPSPWSLVLPKLLTAPLWLIWMRGAEPWRADPVHGFAPITPLLKFGVSVLGSEALLAMRSQLDKLIVGATLGVSALGTYYFAFNAGVGIVSSLVTAFGTVIYPHLCDTPAGAERQSRFRKIAALGGGFFLLIITAQIVLAPYYVPLIFGENWVHAVPLIMIMALASTGFYCSALISAWFRAAGQPQVDMKVALLASFMALALLYAGSFYGLTGAASGWVLGMLIVLLPATFFLFRSFFFTTLAVSGPAVVAAKIKG